MNRLIFIIISLCLTLSVNAQKAVKRPNIVVILSDDVGFEEFGIYNVKKGEASNTPNIDALGEQGVCFKTAWAQSICGPSRSMFYSGNYAASNGAYDNKICWRPGNEAKDLDRFPNFIKILHDAGYKTAVAGKWHNPIGGHLGAHNDLLGVDKYIVWNSYPEKVEALTGVKLTPDENWEIAAISQEPILSRYWKPAYVQNGEVMKTSMKDYGPDILADFICNFIEENAQTEEPFLAFYPMVLAHGAHCVTPIDVANGAEASNQHYKKGTKAGYGYFLNQIRYADQLVGQVVKSIHKAGIADNTIIIYASDNGTTSSAKGKGVEYGVHVPLMVAGAGIKQRGMTDELIDFTDILPTIADFANTSIPSKYNVDGTSVKHFLTGQSNETKSVIYAHPGVSTLIRTKDFMLEAVSPLYGYPNGRFYLTNGSYDGRGYENITHDENYKGERALFEQYLQNMNSKLPHSFDDKIWADKKLKKGLKFFNNEKRKKAHLSLPKAYQFYDPAF
ncbi:sulfatase-like hydrolase/transferase [Carboxylicivirga marina]|uniref:Sulfatase-like hydrolase/transferase n=1 Tax=Carboxylicivirga marina TaxID=2800988 RepID=A0ABS1HQJ2_9BACT|nr:sulfatase-like hydrolase/transferase [Carboxylicivirga marina]MBK3519940.1 sulfatase-like hydrolase/transferase [Carboxylicivirga marina]